MKKTTKLKQLFERNKLFVIPGGGCAIHARIAEIAGFECAYMSGGTTAAMIHGLPDAGLVTLTEMVQNAERMARCVSIPLISDADQGFGNAINVRRTVEAFIHAGVAGIHIEDQTFPKRCGFVKGKEVIPIEEAVGKYRAAVDAKNELDPDFVIIARCDARGAAGGSLDDVITRLRAYREAGVDVIYPEALVSREEVQAVRAAVDGPMMGTMRNFSPPPTLDELQSLGYAAAFYPGMIGATSIEFAYEYAADFKQRHVQAELDWKARPNKHALGDFPLFELVNFGQVSEWEERYLSAESMKKYEQSFGTYEPRIKHRAN